MVSNKTLKAYDFGNIRQYFEYILESHTNGQFKQMNELICELSKNQKIEFLQFLAEYGQNENIIYITNATIHAFK
jgi:hypothetical protein